MSTSLERWFRRAAILCMVAVAVHGADHVRRGTEVVTTQVTAAGTVQFVLVAATLVLVLRRHPWAASAAVAVGFGGAVGFAASHLLPQWSSFSDPFVGDLVAPEVSAFSWATALFEIAADLALGGVGLRVFGLEGRRRASASPA